MLPASLRSRRVYGLALLGVLCVAAASEAVLAQQLPPTLPNPRLSWAFPAGGQIGTTVDVTVAGVDLEEARELRFEHPGITAKLKTAEPGLGQVGMQPVYGSFQVDIAPEVPPGAYELRVLGKFGLSNPRLFCVGQQTEVLETEPNNLPKQAQQVAIGTTINGTCDGAALDYFKFSARQGQRVLVDCQAFRIDSRLDGTLVLYDPTGREVERSHNVNRRDPLIDFTVPADGEYFVSLQDQTFGYRMVPAESFYRLSISTAPFIDLIFPPVGRPGSNEPYTVYGRNLPGGKPAPEMQVAGKPLEKLTVRIPLPAERSRELIREGGLLVEPSESFLDGITYRLATPGGVSNPVLLTMSSTPAVTEQEPNNRAAEAQPLQLPCEYVGQFYPRGDRDWVTFEAKKGDVYWIDLFCQRLGNPTDPRLMIQQIQRDDQGQEQAIPLQIVDDALGNAERVHWSMLDSVLYNTGHYDPSCRFLVPEDGTYRVMIQDLSRPIQDRAWASPGNARFTYRLSIRPPEPDFRLVAVPRPPTNQPAEQSLTGTNWSTVLRRGGTDLIDVYADRRDGFEGEILVTADHLPAGVTAQPVLIAPKEVSATLILHAAEDAPAGVSNITIQGTSRLGEAELVRPVRSATMNWVMQELGVTYHRSRLTDQFPVAVIDHEQPPFSLQIDPQLSLATSLTGTVKFPVKIIRRGNFQGPVDLFVYGLPPSVGTSPLHAQLKYHLPISVPANQDQIEFTLTVPGYQPPGTYTFFLSGVGTVSYAANPEKLAAAETRLAAIEQIVAENEIRLKAAREAQSSAAKTLADAQAAQQNVPAATEAKAAADKAVAEADAKSKADAAFLETFRLEVVKLKEKCKPTDLKISAASTRATLKMSPAPFEITLPTAQASVRQGAKLELPVTVKRLYGFADPIQVQFLGAYTISGIAAPVVTIPAGQSEGRLVIEVPPGTTPGRYVSSIQSTGIFNSIALHDRHDFTLTIEPANTSQK